MSIIDLYPTRRQRREHSVFNVLLQMVPGLEDRLMEGSEDDVVEIATMASRRHSFLALSLISVYVASERCF